MDLNEVRKLPGSSGPKPEISRFRPISADSHITEPPQQTSRSCRASISAKMSG